MNLYTLLPSAWRPYAKTVVAVLGTVLSVLALSLPSVPAWVPITMNVLTALGVWGVPNAAPDATSTRQADTPVTSTPEGSAPTA